MRKIAVTVLVICASIAALFAGYKLFKYVKKMIAESKVKSLAKEAEKDAQSDIAKVKKKSSGEVDYANRLSYLSDYYYWWALYMDSLTNHPSMSTSYLANANAAKMNSGL